MERKYKVLRVIAFLLKVFGIILAVLTILTVIVIIGTGLVSGVALERFGRELGSDTGGMGLFTGIVGGVITTVLPIIIGGSFAMFLYAAGEAVQLQIDIEENTRSVAWLIERQTPTSTPIYSTQEQKQPISETSNAPAESSIALKKFCPQCGTKISETDTSCPHCGYVLIEQEDNV
jgi:hypothetical protein